MRPRHLLLGGGLAISVALATFGNAGPKHTTAQPKAPSTSPARPTSAKETGPDYGPAIVRLLPRDRVTVRGSEDSNVVSNQLFVSLDWTPSPPPGPPATAAPPAAQQAPSAPPLPFTILGKSYEEGKWEVYLGRDKKVFVARDSTVLDEAYRVESIKPPVLTLTYLPLKQTQEINIGVFE
jgi:hypothetical protein